jgi:RNA polymerase sigma-70 factor (ECF subfamily)
VLDVESFAALLTDCYQRCWLIAAAVTGDRVEADDIVQEASVIALRKLADFKAGTNFTGWMSQIVRLTALNHAKKSGRRSSVPTDPVMIDRTSASAVMSATVGLTSVTRDGRLVENQSDFDYEVLFALREISDEARACLLLRVVLRLSYGEIAQTLHIPEGTAMSHVHRAKQALRQRLKDRPDQPAKSSENGGHR